MNKKACKKPNKRVKEETLDGLFKVDKTKGQEYMLHLWTNSGRKWYARGAFYTKVGRRVDFVFPRGKCAFSVLQLQYKPRRQSVFVWSEVRRRKGKRVVRSETKIGKVERTRLSRKNKIL